MCLSTGIIIWLGLLLLLGLVLLVGLIRSGNTPNPYRPCAQEVLDRVYCVRRHGHHGRHAIYPADVVNAGFVRRPF